MISANGAGGDLAASGPPPLDPAGRDPDTHRDQGRRDPDTHRDQGRPGPAAVLSGIQVYSIWRAVRRASRS
ncbi:hypothetical protein ACFVXQ_28325, partial [Kitasatospora sp. NPDC058263]